MKSPHLDQIDVVCDHSDPAQGLGRLLQRCSNRRLSAPRKLGCTDSTPDACFARKRASLKRCRVSRLVTGAGTALLAVNTWKWQSQAGGQATQPDSRSGLPGSEGAAGRAGRGAADCHGWNSRPLEDYNLRNLANIVFCCPCQSPLLHVSSSSRLNRLLLQLPPA